MEWTFLVSDVGDYYLEQTLFEVTLNFNTEGSESGEFVEIVKKMFLQGKPPTEDNIFHMKRELGDIMWYWVTACAALKLDPYEVISENQQKLEARYGEQFEVQRSEVRKEGDL